MKKIYYLFGLFLMFCFHCKKANLCNPADIESQCGILNLAFQKPISFGPPKKPQCSPCRMFVSAASYNANLQGISGADVKCSIDPNKPADGIYKALLVDDVNRRACTSANCSVGGITEQIDWVVAPNISYYSLNTSALIFTSDLNGVFTGSFATTMSAPTGIWTGIKNNPSWDWQTDTSHTCTSWSDNVSANCGTYGVTSWQDSRAIAITSAYGNGGTLNNILCIEQ